MEAEKRLSQIKELRSKLPKTWRWRKCYEFEYVTYPYLRKHWALEEKENDYKVCSLGLISHDSHSSNRDEFMKDDIPVQFVEQSLQLIDDLLTIIESREKNLYPEEFVEWVNNLKWHQYYNGKQLKALPIPELFEIWSNEINK